MEVKLGQIQTLHSEIEVARAKAGCFEKNCGVHARKMHQTWRERSKRWVGLWSNARLGLRRVGRILSRQRS